MNIKQFEAATGVQRTTIRFYETRGLMKPAETGPNGYRRYGPLEVERVRMIRLAQSLGFSLREIADLMDAWEAGAMSKAAKRAALQKRLAEVNEKRTHLKALALYLQAVIAWVDNDETGDKPAFPGAKA